MREHRRQAAADEEAECASSEDLVEYEDAFGRTRRCPRRELNNRLQFNTDLAHTLETVEEQYEAGVRQQEEKDRSSQVRVVTRMEDPVCHCQNGSMHL